MKRWAMLVLLVIALIAAAACVSLAENSDYRVAPVPEGFTPLDRPYKNYSSKPADTACGGEAAHLHAAHDGKAGN